MYIFVTAPVYECYPCYFKAHIVQIEGYTNKRELFMRICSCVIPLLFWCIGFFVGLANWFIGTEDTYIFGLFVASFAMLNLNCNCQLLLVGETGVARGKLLTDLSHWDVSLMHCAVSHPQIFGNGER